MKDRIQKTRTEQNAGSPPPPAKVSPPAMLLLCAIMRNEVFRFTDLQSVAGEAESLREIIGDNPRLKAETEALSKIIGAAAHFNELEKALHAI